jgi:hypothetical protein
VSGTIGQPDAGAPMTGGPFSISGGFWSLPVAVQIIGAPTLCIRQTGTNTPRPAWADTGGSWQLQGNSDLNSTHWFDVPEAVQTNGASRAVMISASAAQRCYRLARR